MKIGTITLYYNTKNYGGVLQAYALTKFLCNEGHDAKQITFNNQRMATYPKTLLGKLKVYGFGHCFKRFFQYPIEWVDRKINDNLWRRYKGKIEKRSLKFKEFREKIPHTKVYTHDTIFEISDCFECYVAGGDQIWNPKYWSAEYFLQFVKDKKKISISASIGTEHYTEEEQRFARRLLGDFDMITVREESAKRLLKSTFDIASTVVLDPVMLLSAEDWERIAEIPEETIDFSTPYMLCYLLGKNEQVYKKVKWIAKHLKLPIVYLSFAQGPYKKAEERFGDVKLYSVGPEEFLYLLRHCSCMVTDSFHGSVFSVLFHRPFWTMPRYDTGEMVSSDRLYTFLKHLAIEERFFSVKEERDWSADIDWNEVDCRLKEKIIETKKCIRGMLND